MRNFYPKMNQALKRDSELLALRHKVELQLGDILDVDLVVEGYLEALFFGETITLEDGEIIPADDAGLGYSSLTVDSWALVLSDVLDYLATADTDYPEFCANVISYIEARGSSVLFGHDIYFTQAGHGVGFWDHGLGDVGDYLTDRAGHNAVCVFIDGDSLVIEQG